MSNLSVTSKEEVYSVSEIEIVSTLPFGVPRKDSGRRKGRNYFFSSEASKI